MVFRSRRLRAFAVAALVGLLVMGTAVALLVRNLAAEELEALGMDQHESMARSLSAALHRKIVPVLEASHEAGPLHDNPDVRELRQYLVKPLRGMRVVRIKIYAPDGRTVFSSDADQIGEMAADNEAFLAAMAGRTVNELIHHDAFNVSDNVAEDRDLLETYVPIRLPGIGTILGVFELYTDMTSLLSRIERARRRVVINSVLVMGAVVLVLLVLFRRNDIRLRREEDTVASYLTDLNDAREGLERTVEARTRELAGSKQRFQDVADAAGEYIWEVDEKGRFTFATQRVSSVLGYSVDELLGRTPLEFALPEDVEPVQRYLREHVGEGAFRDLEHRSITRSGEVIWQTISAVPMFDDEGVFRGYRGAASDITARKRATEALGKMSLATEQSSEVVIITDLQGVIEYVNPAFTRVSGYESAEAIGNTPSMLRADDQPDETYEELWKTIVAGVVWRGVLCNKRKDGEVFWNMTSIFPLRDSEQGITHYVGVQTDITQRQLDHAALQASEAQLRAVMDSVTDAIITSDENGEMQTVNRAACSMFGYCASELIGKNVQILAPQPYRSQHVHYMRQYLDTGEGRIIGVGGREVEGLRRDGTLIPLELGVGAMQVGGVRGFVAVLRDLTERRRHERQMEATRQSYFHREKMAAIGQLAAGIVHEVGNPVAAIVGAVKGLRDQLDGEPEARRKASVANLELIEQQADRLALMTRQISDFTRPRSEDKELLDLNEVVRSALNLMRYDARVQALELRVDLDASIPALLASADQLTQVLLNLVLNAADAGERTSPGGGFIEISTRGGPACVNLVIKDNGCGMDAQTLARARTAYFSTKQPGAGMGLGLSLCEDIVRAHGGRLEIESAPDRGTTICVSLPSNAQHGDLD